MGKADCSYRLVGIVNHHGDSLFAGMVLVSPMIRYQFIRHKELNAPGLKTLGILQDFIMKISG